MSVVILMDFKQKFKNSLSPKVLAVAKSKRLKDKFILSATMLVLANCGGGGVVVLQLRRHLQEIM